MLFVLGYNKDPSSYVCICLFFVFEARPVLFGARPSRWRLLPGGFANKRAYQATIQRGSRVRLRVAKWDSVCLPPDRDRNREAVDIQWTPTQFRHSAVFSRRYHAPSLSQHHWSFHWPLVWLELNWKSRNHFFFSKANKFWRKRVVRRSIEVTLGSLRNLSCESQDGNRKKSVRSGPESPNLQCGKFSYLLIIRSWIWTQMHYSSWKKEAGLKQISTIRPSFNIIYRI